jgi:CRP-like cAMP-binding protein
MRTIEQLLPEHPFFAGLDESAIRLLSGCATNAHFHPGEFLFKQGGPAEHFYIVRHGSVAIEVHNPAQGTVVIDTAGDGEVIGFSWLVPPHRYVFDGRAIDETSAIRFDGTCLRGKCEADPALGYALMQRVATVMYERMQAARVRMLDLYGSSHAPAR